MHTNFCAISFNGGQDQHFPQNSGKHVTTAAAIKVRLQKLYQ